MGLTTGRVSLEIPLKAYKNLMGRCSGIKELYFWQTRCSDGWSECPNGDDEDAQNEFCNEVPTPQPPTVGPDGRCGKIEVTGDGVSAGMEGVYEYIGDHEGADSYHKPDSTYYLYQLKGAWVFGTYYGGNGALGRVSKMV